MATIIENLLEEMWVDCDTCGGHGQTTNWITEVLETCEDCKGKGKCLSDIGMKLIHLIEHEEMP